MASRSWLKREILDLQKDVKYWKDRVYDMQNERIQLDKDKVLFNKLRKSTDERLNSLIEFAMKVGDDVYRTKD